jgi:modification methylase
MIFNANQLYPGDALQIMKKLPDKCVDLIFADPPYNLQLEGELWRPNLTKVNAVDDEWDKFENFEEYDIFTRTWLSQARRIMKDRSSIWVSGTYHNIFRVGSIMQNLGFWILNTVTWFKTNAMPNFNGTRLKNDVEFVIWAKKSEKSTYRFNHHVAKQFNDFSEGKQLGSVWQIPACGGAERLKDENGQKLHSTQKPEELLRRIILVSSGQGDMVFDPFMGTGTTAAVAKRLRREWSGIERDAHYLEAAQKRIDRVVVLDPDDAEIYEAPKNKRVEFRSLVEKGLVRAGSVIYLDRPEHEAVVLSDGSIKANGYEGSIHQVGKWLKKAPSCNGWKHWYYLDETGVKRPIDDLRQYG